MQLEIPKEATHVVLRYAIDGNVAERYFSNKPPGTMTSGGFCFTDLQHGQECIMYNVPVSYRELTERELKTQKYEF